MISLEEFFIATQEKWETQGNATQLDERVIKLCYNILKGVKK